MKRSFVGFLLLLTLFAHSSIFAQTQVKITPAEKKMADVITPELLSSYLHFVASDAIAGRDTPSQGLDVTAEFLKMHLARWGFKPAGDNGTFFQKIALKSEISDPAANSVTIGETKYSIGSDYFKLAGSGSAQGNAVFAGNGWVVKSKNIDPYKGVDVKGKVIVLFTAGFPNMEYVTAPPATVKREDLKPETKGTDWLDPKTYAEKNGAAGILLVASDQLQANWERIKPFFSGGRTFPEKLAGEAEGKPVPFMLVSADMGKALLKDATGTLTSTDAFALTPTVSFQAESRSEIKWTQNVVAIWPGSDPVLKNEMIAIGSHYDHDGVKLNAPGEDKIWNGADDDGSGTVAMLAMAEALAVSKAKPKRSILFVWHAGEEKGLWGSEYFNKFPTVDIKNVVAQLNIDMIGRSKVAGKEIKCDRPGKPCNDELAGPNEVYMIGSEMMSSTLGTVAKGTNNAYLKLDYNYKYDDPKDPNRFFYRSDHFNYAMNGIPVVFWFTGVHEDYHQASDTADKIDYAKYAKITKTILLTAWQLSELKERPKVDKQLPPELTQGR